MNFRKFAGLLWLMIPPITLSALIHMADPDIDGWWGLASYSALWSVFILGLLVVGCVLTCLVVLLESGRVAFFGVSGLFAVVSGILLAYLGSGATTTLGVLWTVVGSGVLVFVTVGCAVMPAVALGWSPTIGMP